MTWPERHAEGVSAKPYRVIVRVQRGLIVGFSVHYTEPSIISHYIPPFCFPDSYSLDRVSYLYTKFLGSNSCFSSFWLSAYGKCQAEAEEIGGRVNYLIHTSLLVILSHQLYFLTLTFENKITFEYYVDKLDIDLPWVIWIATAHNERIQNRTRIYSLLLPRRLGKEEKENQEFV